MLGVRERRRDGDAQSGQASSADGHEQGLDRLARKGQIPKALRDEFAPREVLEVHASNSKSGTRPALPAHGLSGPSPSAQRSARVRFAIGSDGARSRRASTMNGSATSSMTAPPTYEAA